MQTQKGSVLGKGLASLLPGAAQQTAQPSLGNPAVANPQSQRHLGISLAVVDEIKINPYQPRREFDEKALGELSQSIQTNGIIQPLLVRKLETGFELIAGERRLRAAKMAGLKHVPVVIRKSTDKESLELAILENVQLRASRVLGDGRSRREFHGASDPGRRADFGDRPGGRALLPHRQ